MRSVAAQSSRSAVNETNPPIWALAHGTARAACGQRVGVGGVGVVWGGAATRPVACRLQWLRPSAQPDRSGVGASAWWQTSVCSAWRRRESAARQSWRRRRIDSSEQLRARAPSSDVRTVRTRKAEPHRAQKHRYRRSARNSAGLKNLNRADRTERTTRCTRHMYMSSHGTGDTHRTAGHNLDTPPLETH